MRKKAARKSTILELLSERGSLSLAGLAEELDVSLSTIRRDLDELEAQRLVRRSFGAAEIASSNEEFAFTLRATLNQDKKQRIARQALNLIANGDSIYISSGSTTLELARLLPGKFRLTVITNAMRVANCLLDQPGIDLILLGGAVRPNEQTLHGYLTDWAAGQLRADKMFYGVEGISLRHGLTHSQVVEVNTDRAIARMVNQVIVLADHTKFGRVAPALVMPISEVHTIISDDQLDPSIVEELQAAGLRVILA